jgi:hypothetical protein
MLVRTKSMLDVVSSAEQRWQFLSPLASAVFVALLGLGIMFKVMRLYLAG